MKSPPATINNIERKIWVGWSSMGDREVAREAAAKGEYVSLALMFLATRRDWDKADVERWFKTEILTWVYELLERRQVFKASHVLKNIGFDPPEQLAIIMSDTTKKDVRDYLGDHLLKTEKLDKMLQVTWRFVSLLENNNAVINKICDLPSSLSISIIDQKSKEWKMDIATVLFFQTYDFSLEMFLIPEISWKYLISEEKLEIVKLWINVYFRQDLDYELNTVTIHPDVLFKLKNYFIFWEISKQMIKNINYYTCSDFTKDFILNELSVFGIFIDSEKNDVKTICSRFAQTQNIKNIYKTFEEPSSMVQLPDFFINLAKFCVEHNLFEIFNICTEEYKHMNYFSLLKDIQSKELQLWINIRDLFNNLDNDSIVNKNIISALDYVCECDNLELYLKSNPLIILAIIIFKTKENENYNLSEIFFENKKLIIGDISLESDKIMEIFSKLPVLKNILCKYMNYHNTKNIYSNNVITLNELIDKYLSELSEFFNNQQDEANKFYNNSSLNDYSTKISYLYYIKRDRPSRAANLYRKYFFQENDSDIVIKIENLYLYEKINSSSCISFLEMIGCSSEKLRVYTDIINNVPDGYNLIQSNNSNLIIDVLENHILVNYIDLPKNFIKIMQEYNLPVKYCEINNLKLPENILIKCANLNLWLPFLIFVQKYNYSLEQIINLLPNFQNKNITEHIYQALSTQISEDLTTSSSSVYSISNNNRSFAAINTNLLKILTECHSSEDPPTELLKGSQIYKNQLLAVLATCYEPDYVIASWLMWLSVSSEIPMDPVDNYSISAEIVSSLLQKVLSKGYVNTALEGFQIFLPDHPFCLLMELFKLSTNFDFITAETHLKSYEEIVTQLKYNMQLIENDFEYTFLHNGFWVIDTTIKLIFIFLGNCFNSRYHQIKFLKILCKTNFTKNLPIDCPNFCAISKTLQSMSSSIHLNLAVFHDPDQRKKEIIRCIEILLNNKDFYNALELAKYESVFKEHVLNEEWSYKFKNAKTTSFWVQCDEAFESANINPSSAAEFYVNHCKQISECSERYEGLKLAYKWLKKSNYSDPYVEIIEQEIWSIYFALDDNTLKNSHYDKNDTNYLLSELKENSVTNSKFSHELNEVQKRHLEETIGKMLASGDIIEALRLEKMFDYKNVEISILLTCYELAEGKLSPYQLSTEQRMLYMNRDMNVKLVPHRRRALKSTRLSNMSTGSFGSTSTIHEIVSETSTQDTLSLLETLTDRLQHGNNIAGRILMCYRISINSGKPYHEVIKCKDSLMMLKVALDNPISKNKLELINDVFIIYKWNKKNITDFISNEILNAIIIFTNTDSEGVIMWDIDLNNDFHLVLQLCQDINSMVGEKLLILANEIQTRHSDLSEEQVMILIELLIRSHDFFNTECNMEGISLVLRKAQVLTSLLLNLQSWKLMARLLTGIGRYTEMSYVFEILKENEQFEYILRKSNKKDNSLKIALLKFIDKYCSDNLELYKMVALHFNMHSEVAHLWENEAKKIVLNIVEIAKVETMNNNKYPADPDFIYLTNSEIVKSNLDKALVFYVDAIDYYLHGNKLVSSTRVSRLAEMLKLQILFLKTHKRCRCILNLNTSQINILVINHFSFTHGRLLMDCYDKQPDWSLIIHQRCVIKSDLNYFEEYIKVLPVSNTLVQDLTRKFQSDSIRTESSINVMKTILKKLNTVQLKYRLASELGFSDVIESILNGSQLAYLKDTVWKTGFKNS